MRILYDNEIFLIQKYGGVSRYYFELIRRMQGFNTEVLLYMGRFINEYGLENCSQKFSVFSGSKIKHIPRTKLLSITLQKPLFERFAEKQSFDILHQTYFGDINVSKKHKRVVTVYDFTHDKFSENFSKLDRSAKLKKIAIEKADGIICISESTRKDLEDMYNLKSKKVKVIYLANSLKYDINEKSIIDGKYILYIGDRRSYKNFAIMLKLFEINPSLKDDYKLICCGGGEFTKAETDMISKAGLQNTFIQVGANDKKMANLYKHAVAFVYPSKYEGFGIPLLEAMYYDCPIVASNVGSLPEIGGNAGLYFNPDSPEELSSCIETVINDTNIRNDLIQKGREREKLFSWDKCAEETYSFYEEILS